MREHVKRILFRAAKPVIHPLYRQMRGMTLGTRTLVLGEGDGEVLLVRHGYAPGWLLPGGGVERREAAVDAAVREIREEGGIEALEEPRLHGLFLNERQFRGDHVACFVLRRFRRHAVTKGFEIAEARFWPVDALPEGTRGGTRRRLQEVLGGLPLSREW